MNRFSPHRHESFTGYSDQVLYLGVGKLLGFPVIIIVMVITLVLAAFVLRYTHFGRDIYAVGGNLDAARLPGFAGY